MTVAQVGGPGAVVLVVLVVLVAVVAHRSVVLVTGTPRALYVFGEFRAVLRPGVTVVPPFVSETYPVDPETGTVDLGDRQVDLPPAASDALATDADDEHERHGRR